MSPFLVLVLLLDTGLKAERTDDEGSYVVRAV